MVVDGGKWRPFRFRSPSGMTSFSVSCEVTSRGSDLIQYGGNGKWGHPRWWPEAERPPFSTIHHHGVPKTHPILLAVYDLYIASRLLRWTSCSKSVSCQKIEKCFDIIFFWFSSHSPRKFNIIRVRHFSVALSCSQWYRNHSEYGLSQWEKTLQCNAVSYWLSLWNQISLCIMLPFKTFSEKFVVVCHPVHEQVEVGLYGVCLTETLTWERTRQQHVRLFAIMVNTDIISSLGEHIGIPQLE